MRYLIAGVIDIPVGADVTDTQNALHASFSDQNKGSIVELELVLESPRATAAAIRAFKNIDPPQHEADKEEKE